MMETFFTDLSDRCLARAKAADAPGYPWRAQVWDIAGGICARLSQVFRGTR